MSESEEQRLQTVREAVRDAVEKGESIQNAVRDITLKALSEGKLDKERIKAVADAVMAGAGDAVARESEQLKEGLTEAAAGLEEALIKTADALRLAIEEASGRMSEFSSTELKRSLEDLDSLEEIFIGTIQRTARGGTELVRTIAEDLATHLRNSGTSIGEHVARNLEKLQNRLREVGADTAEVSGEMADRIGQLARGILAGLGEALLTMAEGKKGDRS